MALFKEKLNESEAAALYVSHLFKAAKADWKQLADGLKQMDDSFSEVVERAVCAEGYFALALLAQNLGGAVHYSPAFSTRRALAHRLSTWALFCLLADHRDEFLHLESEDILAAYRKYEAVGLRAAKAGDDPITPIANALFIDLFKNNITPFMMKGTDEVNPLISTVFTDLYMLGCTNTFNALRRLTRVSASRNTVSSSVKWCAGQVALRTSPTPLYAVGLLIATSARSKDRSMWVGYFDESGIDDKSKTFCIGGFIATNADWLDLAHAWTQTLSGAGITAFHMTDFEALRGEFQEWKKEQRVQLIDELISVVLSYDVFGIGVGTVREDYTKLIAQTDFISKRNFKPEWWEHPYLFVFQHCIVEAAKAVDGLPPTERIAFVFDRQAQFHARAEAVYAQLQEQTEWSRAARLGSLEFQSKDQAVPLQVADLVVYEIRKGLDHKLLEPEREIRKSMNRLKSRLINPQYFDEAALKAFIACFDEDSTA